jgi:hypothetical protein
MIIFPLVDARLKASAQPASLQKAVVVAHHQMRFDLAHGVQQNANGD